MRPGPVGIVGHEEPVEVDPVGGHALAELRRRSTRPARGGRRRRGCSCRARPPRRGRGRRAGSPAGRVAATTSSASGRGTRIWSRSRSGAKPWARARSSSAGTGLHRPQVHRGAGRRLGDGAPSSAAASAGSPARRGRRRRGATVEPSLAGVRKAQPASSHSSRARTSARRRGGARARCVTAGSCGSGSGGWPSAAPARASRAARSARSGVAQRPAGRRRPGARASTGGQRNPVP